jgi:serine/threonine protein phosphatase PrpC
VLEAPADAARAFAVPISTSQFSCVGERSGNQDAIGYHLDERNACFVVSDGVGGNAGGELASRIAVDTALDTFVDAPSLAADSHPALREGGQRRHPGQAARARRPEPHERHLRLAVRRPRHQPGLLGHVGDSRLYWFRRGALMQRTEDHSLSERSGDAAASHRTAASAW